MDRLSVAWSEFVEDRWKSTNNFSANDGAVTMPIKISNGDSGFVAPTAAQIAAARLLFPNEPAHVFPVGPSLNDPNRIVDTISEILGWSYVDSSLRLRRRTPAVHPRFKWMRAKAITAIDGIGKIDNQQTCGLGKYGTYTDWVITIRFEAPDYMVLEDGQIRTQQNVQPGSTPQDISNLYCEYARFVEWNFKPNVENITRKGSPFRFCNALVSSGEFTGSTTIRTNKTQIDLTWKNVPVDFIMQRKLFPANISAGTGFVNLFKFPQNIPASTLALQAWQNLAQVGDGLGHWDRPVFAGCPPGTLLLLPTELESRADIPQNMLGLAPALNQPWLKRCYDVKFHMIYFNPICVDTTTVTVTIPDPNTPGNFIGQSILVRGHNLFPTPVPVPVPAPNGPKYSWWAACLGLQPAPIVPVPNPLTNGNINSDQYCLYPYYDFERLFQFSG